MSDAPVMRPAVGGRLACCAFHLRFPYHLDKPCGHLVGQEPMQQVVSTAPCAICGGSPCATPAACTAEVTGPPWVPVRYVTHVERACNVMLGLNGQPDYWIVPASLIGAGLLEGADDRFLTVLEVQMGVSLTAEGGSLVKRTAGEEVILDGPEEQWWLLTRRCFPRGVSPGQRYVVTLSTRVPRG